MSNILNPNDFTLIPTPDGHKTVAELCGWGTDPVLREEAFNLLAQWPRLRIVGDIPGRTYTGQRSMLFEIYRGAGLSDPPNYPQEIGCCVSMGMKNACEYAQLIDITQGAREEFKLIFPPYIYGICRNQIGGGRMSSDGAMGVWAAEGVVKYGVIPADAEGCPKYSGSIAKKWGSRSGVPEQFITVGKLHLVKDCAKISSWEDALKALVNGYPLTVASDYGFDMKARSDGFMHHSTSWSHQMMVMGIDDGDDKVEPHAAILNSWGDAFGEIKDFRTGSIWPKGSLRIRKKDFEGMIHAGETFAVTGLNAFEARVLDRGDFNL
jgi:hypothetical protein